MTKLEMLMRHVYKTADDCWLWTGAQDKLGYGRVSVRTYGEALAHRAVYKYMKGFNSFGTRYVLHHCDNPSCVNPSHMFLGSQADNLRDAQQKGRRLGEIPKISDETINDVLECIEQGYVQRDVAKFCGISEATVSAIKHGKHRR